MTGTLHQIYQGRAARADVVADPDAVLGTVAGLVRRKRQQRRTLVAAGTGVVLVATLAAGLTTLMPDRETEPSRPAAPASDRASQPAPSDLVPVAPAPRSAEVSIGLVPAGWVLLSAKGPVTLYGPTSLTGSSDASFAGKLLVSVHERFGPAGTYPLTIAGRRGSYFDKTSPDTYQGVDVIVDATTEVNFQLPDSIHLSRADVLRLANTLDIRRTTEKTHG